MKKKVLFWRNVANDFLQYEEYATTIQALLDGEYQSLDLEKLHVNTISPIYSIRHNVSTRILFSTYQGNICILEPILNHDYAKSRFLRNRHCLKDFLSKVDASITWTNEIEPEEIPSYRGQTIEKKYVDFQQQFIELSDIQEETLRTKFPFVINGPAGSGKTMLAILLLQNISYARTESIIYLTASDKLRDYVKHLWLEMHQTEYRQISFLTYHEFLNQKLLVDNEKILPNTHFSEWFARNNIKAYKISEQKLYQEFRILSGYPDELNVYLQLGEHQSLFNSQETRALVFNLFSRYKGSCLDNLSIDLSIIEGSSCGDYVIIDEAQDFSYAQLKTVLNFARDRVAILLGDHQVLFDGISRYPYIKQFYYEKAPLSSISLPTSYRCSREVSQLTNQVIALKYHLTGGSLDAIETTQLPACSEIEGLVSYFEADDENLEMIKKMQFNRPMALINFNPHDDNAGFENPLVFSPFSIKGLEFDTVILWKPFQNTNALHKALEKKPFVERDLSHVHRPKASQADLQFLNYFNELITAISRAKKEVIIISSKPSTRNHFVGLMKSYCLNIDRLSENSPEINEEVWLQQLKILVNQGHLSQALKIFTNKLHYEAEGFEDYKNRILGLIPTQQSISIKPCKEVIPLPQKTKADKKAQQLLTKSFCREIQLEFFTTLSSIDITRLFSCQIEGRSLINYFDDCLEAHSDFIHVLATYTEIFVKFFSIKEDLLKLLEKKESFLTSIFNCMNIDFKLKPEYNYTLTHIALENGEHILLDDCLKYSPNLNLMNITPEYFMILAHKGDVDSENNIFIEKLKDQCSFNFTLADLLLMRYKKTNEDELRKTFTILKKYNGFFDFYPSNPLNCISFCIQKKDVSKLKFILSEQIFENIQITNIMMRYAFIVNNLEILRILVEESSLDELVDAIAQLASEFISKSEKGPVVENGIFSLESISNLYSLGFGVEKHFTNACQLAHIALLKNNLPLLDYINVRSFYINEQPIKIHYTLLELAIKLDRYEIVQYLLDLNISINAVESFVPVCLAAEHGKLDILKLLKDNGANLDVLDKKGNTAILIAANKNDYSMVNYLLQQNVKLECINRHERTLTHYAMLRFNDFLFIFCIKKGIHLNHRDFYGRTLIINSVINCLLKPFQLLLDAKVDLRIADKENKTALYHAISLNKIESPSLEFRNQVITLLLEHQGYSVNDEIADQVFFAAAAQGDLNVLETMIGAAQDPKRKDTDGNSILHILVSKNHKKVLYQLLLKEIDFDFNMLNDENDTPLSLACKRQDVACVKMLLDKKADLNLTNLPYQRSIIFMLIEFKNSLLLNLALKYGINLNAVDSEGNSPLLIAAKTEELEIVELLLQNRANANSQNRGLITPLFYAVTINNTNMVKLLLKYGANVTLNITEHLKEEHTLFEIKSLLNSAQENLSQHGLFNPNASIDIDNQQNLSHHAFI